MKRNLLILFLFIMSCLLLANCGGSSVGISSGDVKVNEVKAMAVSSLYNTQSTQEMEIGNKYKVRYYCDSSVVIDSSTFPSDINISFDLYKVNSAGVFTGESYPGVGSGFYNPSGGEIELIIPEKADTGLYRLVSFIDYGNLYSIPNKYNQTPLQNSNIHNISDTITLVNRTKTLIEIEKFGLTRNEGNKTDEIDRTVYYSMNDYDLLKVKRAANSSTILDSSFIRNNNISNYVYVSSDTVSNDTLPAKSLPGLPAHMNVSANVVLRGEAASADSYTFVNFYIEPWLHEQGGELFENCANSFRTNPKVLAWVDTFNAIHTNPADQITTPDSLWFDIFVINRSKNSGTDDSSSVGNMLTSTERAKTGAYDKLPQATKDRITRDTTFAEQLLEYYPISFANDTMPHQQISVNLDLWIPETTARFIRDIKDTFTVWRLAMAVLNEGLSATLPTSQSAVEPFRALTSIRTVDILSSDVHPDGKRNVSRYDYANSNDKYYRNLRDWSMKKWGDYFGIWAGYMSDKFMRKSGCGLETSNLFLTTKVFGTEIIIFEQENEACADIKDIKKSYLAKKMVLLNYTVSSKTAELGSGMKVDLKSEPKSKVELDDAAKDKIKDKLKEMFTRSEKKQEKKEDQNEDKFSKKFVEGGATFWIWFIPFRIEGDITGKVGMTYAKQIIRYPSTSNDYTQTVKIGGEPLASLNLESRLETMYSWTFKENDIVYVVGVVEPFGEISGSLRGGIDIWIAKCGIGGELQLIKVGLPIEYGTGFQKTSNTNEFVRFDTIGIGVSLYSGSGRLYLWGKVLWFYGEVTVASWDGWWQYYPIFRANWGANTLIYN